MGSTRGLQRRLQKGLQTTNMGGRRLNLFARARNSNKVSFCLKAGRPPAKQPHRICATFVPTGVGFLLLKPINSRP